METTKSDPVKPPAAGTPVCVGTTPPVTVSEAGYIVILWTVFLEKSVLCVSPLSEMPPLKEESQCCFVRTITEDICTQVV